MKKKISAPQLAVGIVFGLIVVAGVVFGVGYLYFIRLSQAPPKPDYPVATTDSKQNKDDKELAAASGASFSSDSSYVGIVVYPDGLILRAEPSSSAEAIETLEFEETVRVLEQSPDEQWEKVFIETTGQTGWVARGNTERVQ